MVGDAEPAAGVDLGDRAAEVDEMLDHAGHRGRGVVEGGQVFVEHAVGHVEVDGVDGEAVRARHLDSALEVVGVDAELGRPLARCRWRRPSGR